MPILSAKDSMGKTRTSPGPETYWEDSKWANEHFGEIVKDILINGWRLWIER